MRPTGSACRGKSSCGRTGGHGRGTPQPQWDGSMPKIQPRDVAWAPRIRWIEKWVFTPSFPPIRSQELPQTQSHRHVRLTAIGQSPQSLWSVQWSQTVGYPPAIKHGLLGKPACTLMNVPLKAHPNRNLTDSMMAPVPLTTMSSLHYDRHAPLHPGCWRFRSSVVLHSWHRTTWDLSRPSRCRGSIIFEENQWGFLGGSHGIPHGFQYEVMVHANCPRWIGYGASWAWWPWLNPKMTAGFQETVKVKVAALVKKITGLLWKITVVQR